MTPASSILTVTTSVPSTYYAYPSASWVTVTPQFVTSATSAQLTVSVNPYMLTGLVAGDNPATITVTAGTSTFTVNVNLNIGGSGSTGTGNGSVSSDPSSLTFSAATGASSTAKQTVKVTSNTGSPVEFVAFTGTQTGGGWLSVSSSSNTAGTTASTAAVLTVEVDPGVITTAGSYTGQITLYGGGAAQLLTIPVTFNVGGTGTFSASPTSLIFSSTNGQTPASQSVTVGGSGSFFIQTSGATWLSVVTTSSVAPATLTVYASPSSGMSTGTYQANIYLTTSGTGTAASQTISVSLNVGSGLAAGVSPSVLNFTYTPGGLLPTAQMLNVSSANNATYTANISSGASWLTVSPSAGYSPATVGVSVDPAKVGTANGTYSGFIGFIMGDGTTQYVAVNFTVGTGGSIAVSQDTAAFSAQPGATTTTPVYITVSSTSDLSVPYTVTAQSQFNWLQVVNSNGSAPGGFTLVGNPQMLAVGTYTGVVTVTPTTGGSRSIAASLSIGASSSITVSPTSMAFGASVGSTAPPSQLLYVSTPSSTYYSASATSTGNWLTVTPTSGSASASPTALTVSVNPANLQPGTTYYGTITITATGLTSSTATVNVSLTTTGTSTSLTLTPSSLSFTYDGSSTPAPQSISVSSAASGISYTASYQVTGGSWLTLTPTAGSVPGNVQVSVNPAGLAQGTYTGTITFTPWGSATATAQTMNVSLAVTAPPPPPATVSATPANLSFTYDSVNQPSAQAISVTGTNSPANYSATASGTFLSVSPASGAVPGSVSVSVSTAGLAPGTYNGSVTITSAGSSGSPITIPVTLTVQNTLPVFSSVINGASLTPGVSTAGSIISLFGQRLGPATGVNSYFDSGHLATQLDQTRVLVNGSAAPLLYVSAGQVNAILPMGVGGAGTAEVMVEYKGQRSAAVRVQLAEAAPALFTSDASGSGLAAAVNQDGSVNSNGNPAAAGSVVSLYGTGAGLFDVPLRDGEIIPSEPLGRTLLLPTATVGGRDARVLFAGAAPGQVTGVMQVNVELPSGLAAGRQPLLVKIGRFSTQLGVTIAVK